MKRKRALLSLRHAHSSRWNSFRIGLERCGFVVTDKPFVPDQDDIFITWNRFPNVESICREFYEVEALVLVAENPWIKANGAKRGGMVALCRDHHNGAGWWPVGEANRWDSFGVELFPWRTRGERVLILPQRGYGEVGVAMPSAWTQNVVGRISQFTTRSTTVRPHPGLYRPKEPDFSKTWCAVTWASGAAIKALVAGVPVFYEMKNWVGSLAATYGVRDIERPFLGDRLPMFQRLAHAQWFLDEIESGCPFDRFLSTSKGV